MADDLEQDIFDSAVVDETPEQEVEQVQLAEPEQETPEPVVARDEQGRFAPKAEVEASPKPRTEENDRIPPYRLREESEARRAAEQRASQLEAQIQQLQQLQRQQQEQKQPPGDIFEDAPGFVDQRIEAKVAELREAYARDREERLMDKERASLNGVIGKFGEETVRAAYHALGEAAKYSPEASAVVQRAKEARDYAIVMDWHLKETNYKTVGPDPDAFARKRALELSKTDKAFAGELYNIIRGVTQQSPSSTIQMPPVSLNRFSSAPPPRHDDDDDSDAGLFRQATR